MLVIDDSKQKLLKMKEKMLSLAIGDMSKNLAEYKELAMEIDHDCYTMITDKIRNNNYNNLPFEEQINFFTEIIEDYDCLNELQCRFRNQYAKYSQEELALSDLGEIMIDDVRAKASQIEGYLVNIKNLKSNKMELDRLNQALVKATNEQKHAFDLMDEIRRKLKSDVLNAKGRIQESDGSLAITSINLELKNYGFDLNALVDDMALIDEAYGTCKKEKDDASETLEIALSLPNRDDAICSMYMQTVLEANYKFNLLELIKEVFTNNQDYALFKDSLYKIEDLIREIKNGLRELGVKFYINPFDYIKIKDYIAMFENAQDQEKNIEDIKRTIAYLANMIDDMEKANNDFLLSVNDDVTIMKQDETESQTLFVDVTDVSHEEDKKIDEIIKPKGAKENQVINIRKVSEQFKRGRVKEKTSGVIKRVCDMMLPQKQAEIVPELVIDKPIVGEKIIPASSEPDLFEEVEPFEKPVLFDNRSDSGIFDNQKDEPKEEPVVEEVPEPEMPEMFWIPKEESKSHMRR